MGTDEASYRAAEKRLWDAFDLDPRERFLELPRCGVSVRVQEVGEGPAVLYIHGASNAGVSWAPLMAGADGFRQIALDRPGCGLSEALPGPFGDADEMVTFASHLVIDVLDALGLDEASLVATSFGGFIGIHATAANASRVHRLVAIGWPIGAPVEKTPLVMRFSAIPGLGRVTTLVPPTRAGTKAMLRQIGLRNALATGRFTDDMLEWFMALLRHTDTMRNELRTNPPILSPIKGLDDSLLIPSEVRASIETPTGFLWGADDPMGGAGVATEFVAAFPDAELEIMPAAGHAPWIDDPARAAAFTTSFLRR